MTLRSLILATLITACSSNHAATIDGSWDGPGSDGPPDGNGSGGPIVHSFDGDSGPGLAACQTSAGHCDRPEMNVAADGSQVVQVTWQHVNVYTYTGTLISSTPLATFVTNAHLVATSTTVARPYEPHVVYDEFIQRWIVTASCKFDCVMVSETSDPGGNWAGIYLDNDGSDPSMHLGYDANGVYLSEVQAGTNPDAGFAGVAGVYFAIPSSEVQWSGTFAPADLNRKANMPIDGMPSTDQNPNKHSTDPAFFVTRTCNGNCQNVSAYSFRWIVNTVMWSGATATYGSDQLIGTGVGTAPDQWLYYTPIAAVSQLGTATQIRPIESHRLMNVGQNGSHLYTALGSGPCTGSSCGTQGVDTHNLFFWVDLDCTTATACVVAQTGKVSDPNEHLEFATVGAASNGDLSFVAATVGATTNPSTRLWTHAANDAPNTVKGPITIVDGSQPYTCINNPVSFANAVGVSTVRDPLDPTKLWATHQYSNSASPCVWATRVMELAP